MISDTNQQNVSLQTVSGPFQRKRFGLGRRTFVRISELVSVFVLVIVFLSAAIPKVWSPEQFATAVWRYQILPDSLVNLAAITLPWVELLVAIALLSGRWRRAAAFTAMILLSVFTIALLAAIARGINADCGCFSSTSAAKISWLNPLRNIVLVMMASWVWWSTQNASRFAPEN